MRRAHGSLRARRQAGCYVPLRWSRLRGTQTAIQSCRSEGLLQAPSLPKQPAPADALPLVTLAHDLDHSLRQAVVEHERTASTARPQRPLTSSTVSRFESARRGALATHVGGEPDLPSARQTESRIENRSRLEITPTSFPSSVTSTCRTPFSTTGAARTPTRGRKRDRVATHRGRHRCVAVRDYPHQIMLGKIPTAASAGRLAHHRSDALLAHDARDLVDANGFVHTTGGGAPASPAAAKLCSTASFRSRLDLELRTARRMRRGKPLRSLARLLSVSIPLQLAANQLQQISPSAGRHRGRWARSPTPKRSAIASR